MKKAQKDNNWQNKLRNIIFADKDRLIVLFLGSECEIVVNI
jgi:hypothetical protein